MTELEHCMEPGCDDDAHHEARYRVPPKKGMAFGDWSKRLLCDRHAGDAAMAETPPDRIEVLPEWQNAVRRAERQQRAAERKALLAPENRLGDW